MIVELPLWLVILVVIALVLNTIYLTIGDLIAKVLRKMIKDEENDINKGE